MTPTRRQFLTASLATMAPRFAWAAQGDTLRIRMPGDIQTLDPAFMIGGAEEVVMRAIYTSLVRLGDIRIGSPWTPWGARDLAQIDPVTIKFTLRDGMTWSGGHGPVTAEDVKFSYERIADPATASPWAYQFESLDRVEVIDIGVGLIRLKQPNPAIWVATLPYYGGHILSVRACDGVTFTTEPPAMCGPYLLTGWEQKQKITLSANPDWKGPAAAFPKIEIYVVEDDQAAALAYEADAFDYTSLPVSAAKGVEASMPPQSVLIKAQSTRYVWLTINMGNPKLADPRVRTAIQAAIDVGQVLAGAYDGLVARSTGVVQPGTAFARPANRIAHDPARAAALLAEAGVADLTLRLSVMNDSKRLAVAQILQASLGAVGIMVEIEPLDEAAYWAIGDKTKGEGYKSLDLVLMDFAGGVDPSENLVWFRPDQVGVYNWSGFVSAEYEALYQTLVTELDLPKRVAAAQAMEDLMEASGGFVFLCHEPLVVLHRNAFDVVILPDGHPNVAAFTPA